nr:MAG TPA: hypothetical protein [Caudoviricetes sp.]
MKVKILKEFRDKDNFSKVYKKAPSRISMIKERIISPL